MVRSALLASIGLLGFVQAQCPYANIGNIARQAEGLGREHLSEFEVDDSEGFLTSDVGGPIEDQEVLTAGERGPTLLEDFIFRQKITHFDHERVYTIPTGIQYVADEYRSLNELSMPAVLVLTAPSPAMATIPTSLARRSSPRRARRPPSSSASRPSPAREVVPIPSVMSTASPFASTPTRATSTSSETTSLSSSSSPPSSSRT